MMSSKSRSAGVSCSNRADSWATLLLEPFVAESPKRCPDRIGFLLSNRFGADFSTDQVPVDREFVQRGQQCGLGRDHSHRHDTAVSAPRFRAIVLQHDVQDDIVVTGIPVVTVLTPGVGGEMNLDAAREKATFAEVDEGLLKVGSQSMGPASAKDDGQLAPIDRPQRCGKVATVPPPRNGDLSDSCGLRSGGVQPAARCRFGGRFRRTLPDRDWY